MQPLRFERPRSNCHHRAAREQIACGPLVLVGTSRSAVLRPPRRIRHNGNVQLVELGERLCSRSRNSYLGAFRAYDPSAMTEAFALILHGTAELMYESSNQRICEVAHSVIQFADVPKTFNRRSQRAQKHSTEERPGPGAA